LFYLPYALSGQVAEPGAAEVFLSARNDMPLAVLAVLMALDSMIVLFLYKDRKKQMKLCLLPIILAVLTLGYQIYQTQFANQQNKLVIGLYDNHIVIGIFIPVLVILLSVMAYNGIKKDEELVRSVDRLR
jgi:ABC-type transport system involved in multi-copper enzyme maturation permease subunit